MSESRQQRRTRELAALRAAHRPVPRTTPKLERVIEVALRYNVTAAAGSAGGRPSWSAEWNLRGTRLSVERDDEEITALVEDVLEDARLLAEFYAVRLEWTLSGEGAGGEPLAVLLAEAGVVLPDFVS
ncbi:hypothetical protein [Amycolatopsis regifaucium]|uniref:Uncharacterized protein n=1 Tax=Amycolatopsis regifaucium TaxID=546365 RepID=A0A154M9R9_9PSEU|nr:hypothetical protein [Amycolatopsis regifaucium]KZB81057.1 hypothetical protein AVL48_37670 [Amycolatopsis regifaucium]OKA04782.1 hypothetical protein ATP06_0229590 [Amycolatopsis regifaucium]SFJ71335.1 hypothetical protein SAMN04489731_1336 [Amycolatopsis regifaucium]